MAGAVAKLRSLGRLLAKPAALSRFSHARLHHALPCPLVRRMVPERHLLAGTQGMASLVALQQLQQQPRQLQQVRSVTTSASASSPGGASKPSSKRIAERIGVIGAGQMGEALIRGFIKSGISSPGRISCSVKELERRSIMEGIGVGNVFDDAESGGARDVALNSDIIILAVKPQVMGEVLRALAPHVTPRHLIISIAAGIKIKTMEEALGSGARVVRVMPNTPCLVQCGASAYALGSNASPRDSDLVHDLLGSVGMAIQVDEKMMDAVTGLSGSGPAYVFLMIEALADGGVAAGLPRETALALAAQTVAGAAKMVLNEGSPGLMHPGVLKDRVASPAGTTIAGLMELESAGFRGAVMRAVKSAAVRSGELG